MPFGLTFDVSLNCVLASIGQRRNLTECGEREVLNRLIERSLCDKLTQRRRLVDYPLLQNSTHEVGRKEGVLLGRLFGYPARPSDWEVA